MKQNLVLFTLFIIAIIFEVFSFFEIVPSVITSVVMISIIATLIAMHMRMKKLTTNICGNMISKVHDLIQLSNDLSLESHYLHDSSNSQSDAIQVSASSIEETSSMAEQTAYQTKQSNELAREISTFAQEGAVVMKELSSSIESINQINSTIADIKTIFEKVSEKTRMIDEIVFNTKLLSFNASIEAERAGTHGAGFSVVAQEIGKLANNSGLAAKDIRLILNESKGQVEKIVSDTKIKFEQGKNVSAKAIDNFANIVDKITQISESFESIASATREQEIGIKQISKSITQVDIAASENVKVAHSTELLSAKIEDSLTDLINVMNANLVILDTHVKQISTSENFIEWSDSFSVNIQEFDQQHKQLVNIVNELYRAIKSGKTTNVLNDIFGKLVSYTATHFQTEEKYFDQTGYPETDEHIAHHKKLVETALKLQKDFQSGNAVIGRDVMDFLKDWLLNHIAKVDKKYSKHLNKSGVK